MSVSCERYNKGHTAKTMILQGGMLSSCGPLFIFIGLIHCLGCQRRGHGAWVIGGMGKGMGVVGMSMGLRVSSCSVCRDVHHFCSSPFHSIGMPAPRHRTRTSGTTSIRTSSPCTTLAPFPSTTTQFVSLLKETGPMKHSHFYALGSSEKQSDLGKTSFLRLQHVTATFQTLCRSSREWPKATYNH